MTALKKYFPLLNSREELMATIQNNSALKRTYDEWKTPQQEEFLDFCTGVRGVKLLYDSFFKEIMNPEYVPERMNEFLSLLLHQQVKVLTVLPNDTTRIADESSLLVTDLVVSLEDGSLANLEVQKIGYLFPGERSACYSSDLLLRQYKRVRGEKKKKFSYKDVKNVYTIVLFENSPKAFHEFPQEYLHYFEQKSDTGLELNLIQKYLFVPLDIFRKIRQNEGIKGKLEAWLTFLSSDEPEDIIQLITEYPEFKPAYEEVYRLCLNVERVMEMFSKELRELDQNTVQLMIDEMQQEIDSQKQELDSQRQEIDSQKQEIDSQRQELDSQRQAIDSQKQELDSQKQELDSQRQAIDSQKQELDSQKQELDSQRQEIDSQKRELNSKEETITAQADEIRKLRERLKQLETE